MRQLKTKSVNTFKLEFFLSLTSVAKHHFKLHNHFAWDQTKRRWIIAIWHAKLVCIRIVLQHFFLFIFTQWCHTCIFFIKVSVKLWKTERMRENETLMRWEVCVEQKNKIAACIVNWFSRDDIHILISDSVTVASQTFPIWKTTFRP